MEAYQSNVKEKEDYNYSWDCDEYGSCLLGASIVQENLKSEIQTDPDVDQNFE